MAEALRGLAAALREAMRKPPSEAVLLDHYARLCLIADEVVHEVSSKPFPFSFNCCNRLLQPVKWPCMLRQANRFSFVSHLLLFGS